MRERALGYERKKKKKWDSTAAVSAVGVGGNDEGGGRGEGW